MMWVKKQERQGSGMARIRRHPGRFIVLGILLCLAVCTGILLYRSKYCLTEAQYTIQSDKIISPVRVVQLTDLHNSTFGRDNETLAELVALAQPDLIFITGDLLNANVERTDIATGVITKLSAIAPVYVSLGNHETEYLERYGTDLIPLYQDAGATVLEQDYMDVTVHGQNLRIGGLYSYCLSWRYLDSGGADPAECAFLSEFQDTDAYTMLLCHMPVCWIQGNSLEDWDVDCVFSGHIHGGQIILPGIGGVYAPDMGWFPGRLRGLYPSADGTSTVVLSSGLGNTEWIPRFHNVPEIVTVDFLPEPAA